ncbi:unnamed protein product, partial [Pylaiella littoralis]
MPRPDESASTKTVRRRQRRFSGKKDKLRPSEHHGHGGRGSGSFLATGVNFGAISWLWHSTIGALSRSIPRVDFGGKVGREGAGRWADDGTGVLSSTEEAAVFALMLGVAVTASLFICRQRNGDAKQTHEQRPAGGEGGCKSVDKDGALEGKARKDGHSHHPDELRNFDRTDSRIKPAEVEKASGE